MERPRRRKNKDNPYKLIEKNNQGKYMVSFKDGIGILRVVEISKEVYEAFDTFELIDKSQMNKNERHIEQSEIYNNNLNNRALNKVESLEDEIIRKSTFEDLKSAFYSLSEVQKRRIKLYYFEDKTQEEIAKIEGVNIRNVQNSLRLALDNRNPKTRKSSSIRVGFFGIKILKNTDKSIV